MVEPRFFQVATVRDILDQAEHCRYVLFKIYKVSEDREHFKILAGRFYWEGEVEVDSDDWHNLINMLSIKGINVVKSMDLSEIAEKFMEGI